MLAEFEIIPDERVCEPIDCPRCAGMGILEPPAATTRPRVTTSATETACAAAPALSDEDLPDGPLAEQSAHRLSDSGRPRRCSKRTLEAAAIDGGETPVPLPSGSVQAARESDGGGSCADDPPAKAPAGPRSKAARIIALAKALGVQSDAEAAGQLAPF
jgi:hypothetical protein